MPRTQHTRESASAAVVQSLVPLVDFGDIAEATLTPIVVSVVTEAIIVTGIGLAD